MSDPRDIQALDEGAVHSTSKEGDGVYSVRQRVLLPQGSAEKGEEQLDDRDVRKKQVLQYP